jgi:peptide-methionine (S)-S-oxide reductase
VLAPSIALAQAEATFAGGCFWCMEPPFDELDGVMSTTSGYTGGHVEDPSYESVSAGYTGHTEAVRIAYDPAIVGYAQLLEVFWQNIDPLDAAGQFCDRGSAFRSAIFYHSERQKILAEESLAEIHTQLGEPIATSIEPAGPFYAAEGYHQNYYRDNAIRYRFYRITCGRDARLKELWGEKLSAPSAPAAPPRKRSHL